MNRIPKATGFPALSYYNRKLDKRAIKVFNTDMLTDSVSGHRTKNPPVLFFVSIAGALLNVLVGHFLRNLLGIPLYLDTALTMTVTFYGGVFWGVLTGALTNLIMQSIFFYGFPHYLYALCNIAVALVTAVFIRWFPQELHIDGAEKPLPQGHRPSQWQSQWLQDLMGRAIVLVILSFALCLVISVLGGLCALIIKGFDPQVHDPIDPELNFRLALVRRNLPGIVVEIGSRIPVNLLDRLISSFAGYGLAALLACIGARQPMNDR
ncbi:hypothetical protein [Leadbettera azotonutricia]|uniref:Uncharacterized protein n=1 Tax=Leadbettera azotonutricia (strain ATCC BAA-888 / DSM 13862 / ZAS-9) TaxID=545695 RepID=F5YCV3_LEAAZ|nr:hypothetical protein [Leadbettera azotonutricia]AEF82057.1 hypothetical protein TREAZ_0421 [Leadbettera azotonutricia ZAS-9]